MTHKLINATDVEARHGVFRALSDPLGVHAFRINQLELHPSTKGPSMITPVMNRRRSTPSSLVAACCVSTARKSP